MVLHMSGQSKTVAKLSREVSRAAEIRAALQDQGDPQLVLDMIEGETDLHEAAAVIYEETVDDIALAAGLKSMIDTLQERHSRIMRGIETKRNLILMAMERAEVKTIRTPLATLTVGATAPKAVVSDEAQIPAKFWKTADPTLDKAALNEALAAGEEVPGAQLSNGGVKLTIRVK